MDGINLPAASCGESSGLSEMLSEIQRRDDELKACRPYLEEEATQGTGQLFGTSREMRETIFLSTTSREPRAPLNDVLGMTDLLRGAPLNEKQRHCARAIHISGRTLYGKSWTRGHGVMPARLVI